MKYLLVTPSGRQFGYYTKGCADVFQLVFGGQVHSIENNYITEP